MGENHTQATILVPIDNQGVSPATLELLVHVAQQLDRRLLGLILENPRLQRVAELPFTTEILLTGARERELRSEQVMRHSESLVREVRRMLGELAPDHLVSINFEFASGNRLRSALSRAGHLDIFLPRRLRWQAAAERYVPRSQPVKSIAMILSGRPEDDAPVLAATRVVLGQGKAQQVYVFARGRPLPELLAPLALPGVRLCVQSELVAEPVALTGLIARSAYELLILPRVLIALIDAGVLDQALDTAAGQVLIVS